ncbi:hypothetical protein K3495_g4380 [Podosphaera aphanis]|nr:hypothetical protein K3495_g4380 [Podosphaera aphanis]
MALSAFNNNSELKRSLSGFSQATDPMAGLSRQQDKDIIAVDFVEMDDAYDGLADELEETGDDLNDDTFGEGKNSTTTSNLVGTGLDFFGRPLKVPDTIAEDSNQPIKIQSPSKPSPSSTNYSQSRSNPSRVENQNYDKPNYVPEMLVDAKIWGVTPKRSASISKAPPSSGLAPNGRKMMSVEELESAMLVQNRNLALQQSQVQQSYHQPCRQSQYVACQEEYQNYGQKSHGIILQSNRPMIQGNFRAAQPNQPTHVLKRPQLPTGQVARRFSSQPNQKAQNPRRYSSDNERSLTAQSFPPSPGPRHVMHPKQLTSLTVEEKAAFLIEEAKREKRNRKIFLLSKDNGFMTPQDKNFITKIQLQQLISATGSPNEHGIDSIPAEDFYYQVHRRIRGGLIQGTGNSGSNQYGGWQSGMRRKERGSTHMQQMELQVQRAVEAAKNKPKYKKLVIEGSLGKISFSNSKAPKPLLIIKHPENGSDSKAAISARDRKASQPGVSGCDRKTVLTDIENVYNTLMRMEDHDRQMPPPLKENTSNSELVDLHLGWQKTAQKLNQQLWYQLKVHEPIGATTTHPFIAFLSFGKGKKAIPRVFRHISHEQRTTILTMIVVHLDQLDVVRQAILLPGETQLSAGIRENIEHFSLSVMPSLFRYLNETGLDIVTGILGLLLTINIDLIARTRIGVSMLTMILSRAELIKQSGTFDEQQEWIQWVSTYNGFFDALEPTLSNIFPGAVSTGEDVYVWQFLAAIGIGASAEQQQRLVMAVKDRVMETVSLAKTLPPAMSSQRLANVNLFMHSIGLDVGLLS